MLFRSPAVAPYALMGTRDLADRVAERLAVADVVILENHGILTVGPSLLSAFDRLEVLEAAAKMSLYTALLGGAVPLTPERLSELDAWKAARK